MLFVGHWEKIPKNVELLRGFALHLSDRQHYFDAEAILQKALKIDPENKETLSALGLVQLLNKQTKTRSAIKIPQVQDEIEAQQQARRFQHEGYAYTVCDDAHWVEEEDRQDEYNLYLSKKPDEPLGFQEWRQLDDEYLRILYWFSLRELKDEENTRLKILEKQLLIELTL